MNYLLVLLSAGFLFFIFKKVRKAWYKSHLKAIAVVLFISATLNLWKHEVAIKNIKETTGCLVSLYSSKGLVAKFKANEEETIYQREGETIYITNESLNKCYAIKYYTVFSIKYLLSVKVIDEAVF